MSEHPPPGPQWGHTPGEGVPPHWQPTPGAPSGPAGPQRGGPSPPPALPPTPPPGYGYEPPPTSWGAPYNSPPGYPPNYQPAYQPSYAKPSQATTALVLSILGLLCCGLLAIPGTIMGRNEVKAIDAGLIDPRSRGNAQAAFVIGLITLVIYALGVAFYAVAIMVALAAGA